MLYPMKVSSRLESILYILNIYRRESFKSGLFRKGKKRPQQLNFFFLFFLTASELHIIAPSKSFQSPSSRKGDFVERRSIRKSALVALKKKSVFIFGGPGEKKNSIGGGLRCAQWVILFPDEKFNSSSPKEDNFYILHIILLFLNKIIIFIL